MTSTLAHRGPDASGTWLAPSAGMGFRALLSDPAERGGPVPARVEAGSADIVAAYAGELYNHAELTHELEVAGAPLRSRSAHELLAHAWLRWGPGALDRLDGMFALAVWDGRTRTMLLARDPLGVKPLYYAELGGGHLFASEPKGIYAHPEYRPQFGLAALPIVLQPRLALPGETPVTGLREVPAGHYVVIDERGAREHPYWQLTSRPHEESFSETAQHVRHLLNHAVTRALSSPGPYSAMLSGGVDSTSVAALAAAALGKDDQVLDTCCIRFDTDGAHFTPTELRPDVDAPYAQAAAEHLGTRHRTITATPADLGRVIPATRKAWDLPGWGQFDASMYLLFEQLRSIGPAGLTGEAADEFFGGYPYFFKASTVATDDFPWLGTGPRLSRFLAPEVLAEVNPVEDERARLAWLLDKVPRLPGEREEEARMRDVFFLGLGAPLSIILARKDRMSMAHGLAVHVPFCDPDLVQYVWNVPWSMKSAGGVKGLLKAAVADILPESTLNRRKSAYPHVQNPAYDAALLEDVEHAVNDQGSPVKDFFDTPRITELIARIRASALGEDLPGGASPAYLMIQIVELSHWLDDYRVALP